MKLRVLIALVVAAFAVGCSSGGGSDMKKEDREKMDTLFREGIKNPPDGQATPEQQGVPLNAAPD